MESSANVWGTSSLYNYAMRGLTTIYGTLCVLAVTTFKAIVTFEADVTFKDNMTTLANFFATNVFTLDLAHNGSTQTLKIGRTVTGAGTIELGPTGTTTSIDSSGYWTFNGGGVLKGNWDLTELLTEAGVVENTIIGGRLNGDALNTTGVNNTLYGYRAGDKVTSGSGNSCIGGISGGNITTGSSNTILGQFAGTSITTANDNVIIGSTAGQNIVTACNTFMGSYAGTGAAGANPTFATGIGCSALYKLGVGGAIGPTAVGKEALYNLISGDRNTAVGLGSLYSIATADDNTSLGFEAGYQHTGGENTFVGSECARLSVGTANGAAALGFRALYSLSSASQATAVGSYALQDLTSGVRNTAVGTGAMETLQTGADNTALGAFAGQQMHLANPNNSTFVGSYAGHTSNGEKNTYIGAYAGEGELTLQDLYNTAVGYKSMNAITFGDGNASLGYETLKALTSGHYNCAFGYQALLSLTTGVSNIAIGSAASLNLISNDHCVAIGENALRHNTVTGAVGIGYNAGSNISSPASGAHVFIGYGAGGVTGFGANYTADESVGIGYNCLGKLGGGVAAYNTAVGAKSMENHVSGEKNTAMGHNSLGSSVDGRQNVAFGFDSAPDYVGAVALNDRYCSFFGTEAGYGITGGRHSAYIGSQSGNQLTSAAYDNHVVLGNSFTTDLYLGSAATGNLFSGTGSITNLSDRRDKMNISTLEGHLSCSDYINAINPKRYKRNPRQAYKDLVEDENGRGRMVDVPQDGSRAFKNFEIGFIAQEVLEAEKVLGLSESPLVYTKDPEYLQMTYGNLIPILVGALKETNARVQALEEALERGKRKYAEISGEEVASMVTV